MVGHVAGLAVAFSGAAAKDLDAGSQALPAGGADSHRYPGCSAESWTSRPTLRCSTG
ncbi:hypothetical protein [Parafrankia sp. FMc2]|uniref:hypothetical protein n=1 Tax=Parafrankia sp. FMc2 TaxID=3233196 RepID=UPI0034D58245